ncbi:MAG: MerR family transcriptional regulator [Candidatus Dormibacteria bacterium]
MTSPAEPLAGQELRIGEVAAMTGVTTRTLRYYEEIGLISPCSRLSGGQERRYTEVTVARVRRIRELQEVLGSGLSEIREALLAEDRMEALRQAYRRSTSRLGQAKVLREAVEVAERQLAQIERRQDQLGKLRQELEERRTRHLQRLAELEAGD